MGSLPVVLGTGMQYPVYAVNKYMSLLGDYENASWQYFKMMKHTVYATRESFRDTKYFIVVIYRKDTSILFGFLLYIFVEF